MMAGRRARAIAGMLVMAGVVSGCAGGSALRAADVESQIASGLADQVGGEFAVTCPVEIPAEAGYRFTCSAQDAAGGSPVSIEVVEDDDSGAFSWRVSSVASPAATDG